MCYTPSDAIFTSIDEVDGTRPCVWACQVALWESYSQAPWSWSSLYNLGATATRVGEFPVCGTGFVAGRAVGLDVMVRYDVLALDSLTVTGYVPLG